MPRNPKSFGSKQDKAAKIAPLKDALGAAKVAAKVASTGVLAAKKVQKAADKAALVANIKLANAQKQYDALLVIPVIPVVAKPAKVAKVKAVPAAAPAA